MLSQPLANSVTVAPNPPSHRLSCPASGSSCRFSRGGRTAERSSGSLRSTRWSSPLACTWCLGPAARARFTRGLGRFGVKRCSSSQGLEVIYNGRECIYTILNRNHVLENMFQEMHVKDLEMGSWAAWGVDFVRLFPDWPGGVDQRTRQAAASLRSPSRDSEA